MSSCEVDSEGVNSAVVGKVGVSGVLGGGRRAAGMGRGCID